MKLTSLRLTNFRSFERLDIDFDERMTVIAGVNGVGKSTILQAIAMGYSHTLPEFTVSREKPLQLLNTDIHHGKSSCIIEMESGGLSSASLVTFLARESLSPYEKKSLEDRRSTMKKELLLLEKGSTVYKDLKNDMTWIDKRVEGNVEKRLNWLFTDTHESEARLKRYLKSSPNQPLVVHYSTNRLLSRLPPTLQGAQPFTQAVAFSKSLTQLEISLNEFAKWHRALNSYRVIRRDNRYGEVVLRLLQDAITGLIPQIKEFWFHEENPPRYSVVKDAMINEQLDRQQPRKELFLEQLSDGERGLIALVFDLTRRLAIANPNSDNPIAEGEALVLIDEVELHLHPSWQRKVLRSLLNIFKSCQFVVTTHSPQIIGQIEPERLRLLYTDEQGKVALTPVSQSFGMDSSWVLQNIMGVPARDYETEQRLSTIYQAIDNDNLEEAREFAYRLRSEIGDFPDLQEAIALLDRFSLLGDEE